MKILENKRELDELLAKIRTNGTKIGLIPTMGSIHDGHLSLVENSIKENFFSITSIFVNPTQFNDLKDFKKYPLRHIFIPITFFFSILYILKQNNDIMNYIKNPLIFTKHIDIWGSLWCFSAIFLGIVSILEI